MKRALIWLSLCGPGVVVALLLFGVLQAQPVHADEPPPNAACRGCHGDNQRQLTLPSGETVPLLVPLDGLNASAHSFSGPSPVHCSDCHDGRVRYRYPHQPNPAQTRREFTALASESCQNCHYPHRPLHEDLQPDPVLLTCADCHGSHRIDRVGNILDSMPANCIACHTDQTVEWTTGFIAPRPGLGEPAEGYAGSDRCAGCHEDIYLSWRETLHARMIQDPSLDPGAIVGDFSQEDPDRTFSVEDVAYTIGSRWKQRYLTRDEEGHLRILPAQWNVETAEWVPYNPDTWQETEWQQACGSCHVTGLNTESWGFMEFGIGCESCHGPGAAHASDPKHVKPFAQVDDQVCGSCHSRGTSPDGYAFPATYRPGDTLADHFTFTTDEDDVWPDGSARKHRQQYMDWQLGSDMALSDETSCVTCHNVHDSGSGLSQLRAPLNDLCVECHNDRRAIIQHIPFHLRAITKHDFTCVDCHMPRMATSAVPYDINSHSFLQPNPQASVDHGGVANMPNSCNLCHTDLGESPQWAADTIRYVAATTGAESKSFFLPGPTPTPPPLPTPLPSVGQPPERVELEAGGRWLRTTVLVILGLILLGIVFLVFRSVRSRRLINA